MKKKLQVAGLIIAMIIVVSVLFKFILNKSDFTESKALTQLFLSETFKENKLHTLDFPQEQGVNNVEIIAEGNPVNLRLETIINQIKGQKEKTYAVRLNESWIEGKEEQECFWTFLISEDKTEFCERKGNPPLFPQ